MTSAQALLSVAKKLQEIARLYHNLKIKNETILEEILLLENEIRGIEITIREDSKLQAELLRIKLQAYTNRAKIFERLN